MNGAEIDVSDKWRAGQFVYWVWTALRGRKEFDVPYSLVHDISAELFKVRENAAFLARTAIADSLMQDIKVFNAEGRDITHAIIYAIRHIPISLLMEETPDRINDLSI